MALFTPSESPAVVVREIDLTGGVPNVQSTTGAYVGNFRWGPVDERVLVANESELVETFGSPTDSNAEDFLTASQFLRYSSALYLVRATDSDATIRNANDAGETDALVKTVDAINSYGGSAQFLAKYPGTLGNSISVKTFKAGSSNTFGSWAYAANFDGAPGTSPSASSKASSFDEVHVVIVDSDGDLTGTRGTVLETFPNLSILSDAKNSEGQSVYAKEVINQNSNYIWCATVSYNSFGSITANGTDYSQSDAGTTATDGGFGGGANTGALDVGDYLAGYDLFEDKDQVEVDFLIAPNLNSSGDQTTIVNDLTATAQSLRKDCVVVTSPNRNAIVGVQSDATKVTNTVTAVANFTRSSYLIVDNNFLKIYDKYNDKYQWVPAASTVAGVMASTDFNRAPWFSPAGSRRGQMLGITSLAYSPTKGQRDTLYRAGVNPIANIPGQGSLLFGDKTFLGRPSAFDRINVRRLFLILERAIGRAAEQVLFEFNDEFTRAEFVNIVEPVLREVRGRRGITDFRVVCDDTNNTAAVVDRNEFKADIFIKPARSINYVTLNFVAVRTGVDFEEVVGTV
jgi:phage tail sheath protein FI